MAGSPAYEAILRFAELLWQQGDVREVRVPNHNKFRSTASGYFDSPEALARGASAWDGRANVYLTLNPVNPALLARATNRISDRTEQATTDDDIVSRRWLFVDIDPARPSGISSTDEERDAAATVLDRLTGYLAEQGWPRPIKAMSGNGYYALYRLDLPNSSATAALLKRVLGTLADRFDTKAAHIDPSVYNAARIACLIGTKKQKGDATEDRPHRVSELMDVPDFLMPVTEQQLYALAPAPTPARPPAWSSAAPAQRSVSLVQMLNEAGIEYREQAPDARGVTWYHVRRCPFHEDGRDFECGMGQSLPDGPYAGHGFLLSALIKAGRNGSSYLAWAELASGVT
jgi:hypothetical protein